MRPHLRTRLTAAALPTDRCKVRVSPRSRSSASTEGSPVPCKPITTTNTPTTTTITTASSSTPRPFADIARGNDWKLFRRARRVQRWLHLSRTRNEHTRPMLVSNGWRPRRAKRGFELFTRESPMIGVTDCPHALPSLLDSEVVAVGTVHCSIEDLARPLRSSSESDYNSVMQALYGSDFIYGSLVHKTTFRRMSKHHTTTTAAAATAATAVPPPTTFARGPPTVEQQQYHQLVVKACAFAHTSMFDKTNQQLVYAELFSPSATGGFRIATFSLAGRDVTTDKDLAVGRPALHPLHPFSTWISVEPVSSGVHVVFRARFHRSESDGACSPKILTARLYKLAEGMCRLRKLVATNVPTTTTACEQLRQSRRLSSSTNDGMAVGPRNSRCTVCTRRLYRLLLLRSYTRCELCAYNVCNTCCSHQQVAIYNRHVAPLRVCSRCRESLARKDFDSQLRDVYDLRQSIA